MVTRNIYAIAVALQFLAGPAMAQVTSDKDENAHHYLGGPKTVVPHTMNHPQQKSTSKVHTPTSHHYSGGPQNPSHHMGDKQ